MIIYNIIIFIFINIITIILAFILFIYNFFFNNFTILIFLFIIELVSNSEIKKNKRNESIIINNIYSRDKINRRRKTDTALNDIRITRNKKNHVLYESKYLKSENLKENFISIIRKIMVKTKIIIKKIKILMNPKNSLRKKNNKKFETSSIMKRKIRMVKLLKKKL